MTKPTINFSPGGLRIRGAQASEDIGASTVVAPRLYPSSLSQEAREDHVRTLRLTEYSTDNELDVVLTGNTSAAKVVGVAGAGVGSIVAVGNKIIRKVQIFVETDFDLIVKNAFIKKMVTGLSIQPGAFSNEWLSPSVVFNPGTLAHDIQEYLTSILPANQASADTNCPFLPGGQYGVGNVSLTDNPNFFLKHIDWSGITVSTAANRTWPIPGAFPMQLISPRHAVFSAHTMGNTIGNSVAFRRMDRTVVTATVIAQRNNVTGSMDTSADLSIVYFDKDVSGCTPFKLLPPNTMEYLPMGSLSGPPIRQDLNLYQLSILRMANNGTGEAGIGNAVITSDAPKYLTQYSPRYERPVNTPYRNAVHGFSGVEGFPDSVSKHSRAVYGGDSGSPVFFLIRERKTSPPVPVLVSMIYTAGLGLGFGPQLFEYIGWLQNAMNEMAVSNGDAPTHQIQFVNLSRFPRFNLGT